MRPRISQNEAAYLVQVLKAQIDELKEKYENLAELERVYSVIIYNLRNRVQGSYEGYRLKANRIVGDGEALSLVRLAEALKEEHPNLRGEKYRLWEAIRTHETLLLKYQAIAEGKPHDGRYKHLSVANIFYPKAQ